MSAGGRNWADLGVRLLSALVLIAIGGGALLAGDVIWYALLALACGLMLWELIPMCDPQVPEVPRRAIPFLMLVVWVVVAGLWIFAPLHRMTVLDPLVRFWGAAALYLVPLVIGVVWLRRGRRLFAAYGALILFGAVYLFFLRSLGGVAQVLALIALIAISDTAGYLVGRAVGGALFWPSISPKKTWSGTIGGWVACALFGAFVGPALGIAIYWAVPVAVALSFAGQMGDIAESAIKRRAGYKDASALIPGHGGLMDRFDALLAASALAALLALATGG